MKNELKKYKCNVCSWVYDPQIGDVSHNIAPGTAFKDLPPTWACPSCYALKDLFCSIE